MSGLLFAMFVVVSVSPVVVVLQLTSNAHSKYRDRLWEVRDAMYDELRRGDLSRTPTSESLFKMLQDQVDGAGKVSFTDVLLGMRIYRDVTRDEYALFDPADPSLSDSDRRIITGHVQELAREIHKYLMWGSLSGWIAFGTMSMSGALRSRRLKTLTARAERAEQAAQELIAKKERAILQAQETASQHQISVENFTFNEMAHIAPKRSGVLLAERPTPTEIAC